MSLEYHFAEALAAAQHVGGRPQDETSVLEEANRLFDLYQAQGCTSYLALSYLFRRSTTEETLIILNWVWDHRDAMGSTAGMDMVAEMHNRHTRLPHGITVKEDQLAQKLYEKFGWYSESAPDWK
jgi:hypothetical protein